MHRSIKILPRAVFARFLISCGAKRVSREATDLFSDIMQEYAEKVAGQAVSIAKHSGRKTVNDGDIKIAAKV